MKGELLLKDFITKIQNRVQVDKIQNRVQVDKIQNRVQVDNNYIYNFQLDWSIVCFFYVTDDCVVNPF